MLTSIQRHAARLRKIRAEQPTRTREEVLAQFARHNGHDYFAELKQARAEIKAEAKMFWRIAGNLRRP